MRVPFVPGAASASASVTCDALALDETAVGPIAQHGGVHGVDSTVDRSVDPLCVLVFSNGQRVLVDRSMVLGRNPKAIDPASATRVVRVLGPGVSRRHATIRVEGWRAYIDDLGSSNGTRITCPGLASAPVLVGTPAELVVGAVVDLGGDVSFVVEEVA